MNEIIDIVSSNFATSKDAFDYFASFGPSKTVVYKSGFDEATESLFPQRFNIKDKENLWNIVSRGGTMGKHDFYKLFHNCDFTGSLSLSG